MKDFLLPIVSLLLLAGGCSNHSLSITDGKYLARERGYVNINPIRMTEISSDATILNLDNLTSDSKALEYLKDSKQEDITDSRQKSISLAGSVGKNIDDGDKTTKATSFDPANLGTNSTNISYSDLIELAANSQLLARSLVRRFSNITTPSSEHKIYCIPVDITFFPGTITNQNYRADIILKFNPSMQNGWDQTNDPAKKFKIFAVAPYEYSKISAAMQTRLKELFITAAAKGTVTRAK